MLRRFVPLAALALFATVATAQTNVGTCNINKVFEKLDERKVIQDNMGRRQQELKVEIDRRQTEAKEIQQQRDQMKPGTPQWDEKNNLLMQKAVEFDVWGRMQQANLVRQEKQLVIDLHTKIRKAVGTVAAKKKLDLVLAENRPELPVGEVFEKMAPNDVRALFGQHNVLFSDDKVDITMDVVGQLNTEFATGGAGGGPQK